MGLSSQRSGRSKARIFRQEMLFGYRQCLSPSCRRQRTLHLHFQWHSFHWTPVAAGDQRGCFDYRAQPATQTKRVLFPLIIVFGLFAFFFYFFQTNRKQAGDAPWKLIVVKNTTIKSPPPPHQWQQSCKLKPMPQPKPVPCGHFDMQWMIVTQTFLSSQLLNETCWCAGDIFYVHIFVLLVNEPRSL